MTINKHFAFLLLAIFAPLFLFAQQVETRRYILSSGDTVRIINKSKIGILSKEEASFLLKDTTKLKTFADMKPKYASLEEAAYDVTRLLQEVEATQAQQKQTNAGLGVRIAAYNREKQNKEKKAIETANDILSTEKSLEELTALYVKFGNKPTYYINGIEVSESQVTKLSTADKATRNLVITNPVSGNPNGEVWYNVSEAVFQKLKIQATTTNTEDVYRPSLEPVVKEIILIEEDVLENGNVKEELIVPSPTKKQDTPPVYTPPPAKQTIVTKPEQIQPVIRETILSKQEIEPVSTTIAIKKSPVLQKKSKKTVQRLNGSSYGEEEEFTEDDEPISSEKKDPMPKTIPVLSTKKDIQPAASQSAKPIIIIEEEVIEKDIPASVPQIAPDQKTNKEEKKVVPAKDTKRSVRKIKEKQSNN